MTRSDMLVQCDEALLYSAAVLPGRPEDLRRADMQANTRANFKQLK